MLMVRYAVMLLIMSALLLPLVATAAESTKTESLTAKEFSFRPASVTLKVGQRGGVKITNAGTMDHEFLSPVLNAAKDVEIKVDGVRVAAAKSKS